jgi:hypothetical protein
MYVYSIYAFCLLILMVTTILKLKLKLDLRYIIGNSYIMSGLYPL